LTNRSVFERFLYDIYQVYKQGNGDVYKAISGSKLFSKLIDNEANKDFPQKQILDKALRDDPVIREAVWTHFNLDENPPYPVLSNDLLFGTLSNMVHNYHYNAVLISDEAPTEYMTFFKALATYQKRKFELFSAVAAAAGKKLLHSRG
jgi:hypothetical protein